MKSINEAIKEFKNNEKVCENLEQDILKALNKGERKLIDILDIADLDSDDKKGQDALLTLLNKMKKEKKITVNNGVVSLFVKGVDEAVSMEPSKFVKLVTSVAWAKKVKNKWSNVLTNAGDKNGLSKERTPEDVVNGTPRVISQDGINNLFKLYINSAMDEVGANIGAQAWDSMTVEDVLKMVNNVYKEIGARGYDKIEGNKIPKTEGSGLRLKN